jgi:hypothetical protein
MHNLKKKSIKINFKQNNSIDLRLIPRTKRLLTYAVDRIPTAVVSLI